MDQFNHNILERDIKKLSKEIAEKRILPEYKGLSEKELLRQALQPLVKQSVSQLENQLSKAAPIEKDILPDYLRDSPNEIKLQVERLIDSVFHKGIEKTAKEANLAGAFILDSFHDALTDKLYEELKNRKLL